MTPSKAFTLYLDKHTNKGLTEPGAGWGDDETLDTNGVELLNKFEHQDWEYLSDYWKQQSDIWIELLIHLVSQKLCSDSKNILVDVARYASDESTMNVMEYVRDFFTELDPSIAEEIDQKSWQIIKNKMDAL